MSLFKRGKVYWYKFQFAGILIRETSHSTSKEVAARAERERRRQLELGINHLEAVRHPRMLSLVMEDWLRHSAHWAANTLRINRTNCGHLSAHFGRLLANEVTAQHISRYQAARLKAGVAPKTINLEIATLRQILRAEGFWAPLQGKVKMLRTRDEVGRALTPDEISRIEAAALQTRSRSLPVALTLYRFTGMRLSELRLMQWHQVDLLSGHLIVGRGKTKAGEGRKIPLASKALRELLEWRGKFPGANPAHYVFPSERYGLDGENGHKDGDVTVYDINPGKPIGSWKTAWTRCREIAGVKCRTHDFRHSFVSRLAESPDVSDATMMALTGHVSKRMLEHYTHSRVEAKRKAVELLLTDEERGGHTSGHSDLDKRGGGHKTRHRFLDEEG